MSRGSVVSALLFIVLGIEQSAVLVLKTAAAQPVLPFAKNCRILHVSGSFMLEFISTTR